jgi:hypothetical protein
VTQEEESREQEIAKAPVRGTQSFVGVMTEVWVRPSLAGMEIAWRWLVGVVMLYAAAVALGSGGVDVKVDAAGLQNLSAFQPVAAIQSLHALGGSILAYSGPALRWMVPSIAVLWLVVSALGRTFVLRRLDGTLRSRRLAMLVLSAMRAGLLAVVWGIWIYGIRLALRISITGPASRQTEPSLVLFCAMLIVGTLAIYVLWGAVSWPFYLAPLLAMQLGLGPGAALKAAFKSGAVRGKLIEINMVMNIVRIALIVLAMVFSASPLPFSSVESQTFLNCWWAGVGLVYLGMSDYFHVVRSAAYLSLWRAYNFPDSGQARGE